MNSDRYSFKIEFDRYVNATSYHGLNNLFQDNSCMKDYLTYHFMGQFGVAAPLCSFLQQFDFPTMLRETAELIVLYLKRDSTAFCRYDEFTLAVDALAQFCDHREQRVAAQLAGETCIAMSEIIHNIFT